MPIAKKKADDIESKPSPTDTSKQTLPSSEQKKDSVAMEIKPKPSTTNNGAGYYLKGGCC